MRGWRGRVGHRAGKVREGEGQGRGGGAGEVREGEKGQGREVRGQS